MKKISSAILMLTLISTTALAQTSASPTVIRGQTEASAHVEVPTVISGQLVEVLVKEGQSVKKGDVLVRLDDGLQKKAVELARAKADSTVDARIAEANVEYARNDVELYKAKGQDKANPAGFREKVLILKQVELKMEQEKELQQKSKLELDREVELLNKLTIVAPMDGSVLRIKKQAGESINANETLVELVQTRKLNIVFFPPKEVFGKLKLGDPIKVELATDPVTHHEAKVIAVDPVIDAASQFFRVKLEMENQENTVPAGISATWTWQAGTTAKD